MIYTKKPDALSLEAMSETSEAISLQEELLRRDKEKAKQILDSVLKNVLGRMSSKGTVNKTQS